MTALMILALTTLAVPGRTNTNVSLAANGRTVAAVWAASDSSGATDIYSAVSVDGGTTFGPPVRVNAAPGDARVGGEQPPRVAIVGPAAPLHLVVTWTAKDTATRIRVAESSDGGRTFAVRGSLEPADAPGMRGWENVAADGHGGAIAVWLDHRDAAAAASGARSSAAAGPNGSADRSGSGAASPSAPHAGHDMSATPQARMDGYTMAQRSSLYFERIGAGASAEVKVTAGVCYCCKTAIAAGPHGEIYLAWRQVYPGNIRDIAFAESTDGGRTFSAPVRVSDDKWVIEGCPDDGPAIAVDDRGVVHLAWPTLVSEPQPHIEIFYASTRDGRTFTPRQRVETLGSLKPSHPQIAAVDAGRVAIAWDEVSAGTRKAAVRILDVDGTGRVRQEPPRVLDAAASAVYPSMARSGDSLVVAWTSAVGDGSVIRLDLQRQNAEGRRQKVEGGR